MDDPGEYEFEWDEAKRLATLEKHGIDFAGAAKIFREPHFVATSRFPSEERFIAIGPRNGRIIAVVFTMRGSKRRIITARRARHDEIRTYHARFAG